MWHDMFSHTKFQTGISFCHVTFFQCVWIKPHSSSLTNVENLTSNFCQSFQIFCRENEKEGNNRNCKAFFVIPKRKKKLRHYVLNVKFHIFYFFCCKVVVRRLLLQRSFRQQFKAALQVGARKGKDSKCSLRLKKNGNGLR